MTERMGREPTLLGFALAVVAAASRLVPIATRDDWKREWTAELWHLRRHGDRHSACGPVAFLLRASGSVADAVQLRIGDAQSWRESFARVVTCWGTNPSSVATGLIYLSLAIAANALLIAFARVAIELPRSEWSGLERESRLQLLAIAFLCGTSLLLAGAAAASQLCRVSHPIGSDDRNVWVAEVALIAATTAWLGRSFATFGTHALPAGLPGWLPPVDLDTTVTTAWLVSWSCGLTLFILVRKVRFQQRAEVAQ